MKFLLLIVAFLFLITSCNQSPSQRVNESQLKIYFSTKIKDIDSTMKLESLNFIKLDTTTLKNQYINLWLAMAEKYKSHSSIIKLLDESIKTNRKLQSIYSDISYSLWKNYNEEEEEDRKKLNEYFAKANLLSVDMSQIDSLITKADSLKPVSYVAKCFYTIRKKDQSISKDTTLIRLDLDFNILDNDEYAKQLKRLYKPVSDFQYE